MKSEDSEDDLLDVVDSFVLLRKFSAERSSCVSSLDISPNEDYIAVSFLTNDVATFPMNSILPSTSEAIEITSKSNKIEKEVTFDYVFEGSHHGPVTGMDVCV